MGSRFLALIVLGLCLVVSVRGEGARDRFRLILSNVDANRAEDEIKDFLNYGCEAIITVSNDAQERARIGCRSADDKTRETILSPGNSFLFSIRPRSDGSSEYWCTLLYRQHWVRFDAYSEKSHQYLCPGRRVYKYSIRNDGIYADPTEEGGVKIRSLLKGHNRFVLWEQFDQSHNTTNGLLMTGYVDGGICSDLPDHFDDKAAAITVCNHQCIYVYDNRRCTGPVQKLQATDGCQDFMLDSSLLKKVSALKGC